MTRWKAYLIVFGILGVYVTALALAPKVVAITTMGVVVVGIGLLLAEVLAISGD